MVETSFQEQYLLLRHMKGYNSSFQEKKKGKTITEGLIRIWPLLEGIKFISPDNLQPEGSLLCLRDYVKKQGMDILCDFSDNEKSWCLTWDTSWAHQELYCQKRKSLSCRSSHTLPRNSWGWVWPSSFNLRLIWLLSLFYERWPWQDFGMVFDSVLRTEISVDNIIWKTGNHAPGSQTYPETN